MDIAANRINFDFEAALEACDASVTSNKVVQRFEYVYFFLDDLGPLFTSKEYANDYICYVESITGRKITLTNKGEYTNYWGDLSNLEHARKANSKVKLTNFLKSKNLADIELKNILHKEDLLDVTEGTYYYRAEFGFSGVKNKKINLPSDLNLNFPGVLSEYKDVVQSFGITFNKDHYFICENIIENGAFIGGRIISEKELMLIISEKDIKELISACKNYLNCEYGQFDSFIYQDKDKLAWCRISEINFRKTMGSVVKSMYDQFGPGKWIIQKQKSLNTIEQMKDCIGHQNQSRFVITSPPGHSHTSYYLMDESISDI